LYPIDTTYLQVSITPDKQTDETPLETPLSESTTHETRNTLP